MNDSAKAALKELVTRENLEIIRLNDSHCKEWYDIAPDEFVWLLGHAEYVLTDSFHATVFSLLFHRPFRCFERESGEVKNRQESRLNTLLNYFGLGSCIGAEGGLDYKNISFDRVDEILADKRKASIDSLIEALEL